MISIVLPVHNMQDYKKFLTRALESIASQTYKDIEVVIPDNSFGFTRTGIDKLLKNYNLRYNRFINEEHGMAQNSNAGIKAATGDLIKILYMDDYLAHDDAIKDIVENFNRDWLVTASINDQGYGKNLPTYNDEIHTGKNTIGSPSVLTLKKGTYFDEEMTWLLDCDLYKRLYAKYGEPAIINKIGVVIGIGTHQMTNRLSQQEKDNEHLYMNEKYENN